MSAAANRIESLPASTLSRIQPTLPFGKEALNIWTCRQTLQWTKLRFASFLSGGFTIMAVLNLPEKKLPKCNTVQCGETLPVYGCHTRYWISNRQSHIPGQPQSCEFEVKNGRNMNRCYNQRRHGHLSPVWTFAYFEFCLVSCLGISAKSTPVKDDASGCNIFLMSSINNMHVWF